MNAPQAEAQKTVEHKLRNQEANLEAALRWFDRQLGGRDAAKIQRLELRFPSRSAKPIIKAVAQEKILMLSKSKGVVGIEISVRPHELPLDNDLGHVTVRALMAVPESRADQPPAKGWLARWKDRFLGSEDADADESGGAVDLSKQAAVMKLEEALGNAVQVFAQSQPSKEVGSAVITVIAPELHRALAPKMPPTDTHGSTVWIAHEIQIRGLNPVPEMALHYIFQQPLSDSTNMPSNDDMTVHLLVPGDAQEPARAPSPKREDLGTPLPQQGEGTQGDATPMPDPVKPSAGLSVNLRLLGTWQGGALVPLATPFECNLGPVPAQFSRSTLELKGFTQRADAALARAASNSTPLGFARDGQGGIKIHAATRPGGSLPMYFFLEDLAPCTGEHPLTGPARLVVNGPAPLEHGLLPLVIEVSPDA